jgi:hypothetical protein
MIVLAFLVLVLLATSAVAIWADPPRYPAPPDRNNLDLDLRRRRDR